MKQQDSQKYLSVFPSTVNGVPCDIGVIDYERYVPEVVTSYVETSYPAEGGSGRYAVLNRKTGKRMPWIEDKIDIKEEMKILEQIMAHMEWGVDDFEY